MATALLLALALLAQDAPVATAPTPTAPPARTTPANTPPTDDYGYVSWCYGALGGYADLYDKVMPEVTRIEKAFPGPDGAAAALKEYPAMRDQARGDLKLYRAAIIAAEKASPRPIAEYGGSQIKKGASVWGGSDQIDKARLAQVWMSWTPPGDCETRAKTLETKSNLFGQALNYNVKAVAPIGADRIVPDATPAPVEPATATPETEATVSEPVTDPMPIAEAPAPAAKTTSALPPIGAKPAAKPLAKAEFVIDPANPKPCPGSLQSGKRAGKSVLICKPD